MPGDDLLRFIGGPLPLSPWWLVLAISLVVAVVAWCVAVLLWTLPPQRLRGMPALGGIHDRVTRHRFLRSLELTTQQFRDRALSPAEASSAYGRTLRRFLFVRTGIRAQYLHLTDLASSELSQAVPLLSAIDDAQFNAESRGDVAALGRSAERLVRTWT